MFFSVFFNNTFLISNGTLGLETLSQDSPLWFHNSSSHLEWPCIHDYVCLYHSVIRDKPKVSGVLGV